MAAATRPPPMLLFDLPLQRAPTRAPAAPARVKRPVYPAGRFIEVLIRFREREEESEVDERRLVPFDHGQLLKEALVKALPILRRREAIGWSCSLLSGARQSVGSGLRLARHKGILPELDPRKMILRVPRQLKSRVETLRGRSLRVGSASLPIVGVEVGDIEPKACLGCRSVVLPATTERQHLLEMLDLELEALGIFRPLQLIEKEGGETDDDVPHMFDVPRKSGHILVDIAGGRSICPDGVHMVHGYEIYLSGWGSSFEPDDGGLTPEESLTLQANGLGSFRQMGMGFFV